MAEINDELKAVTFQEFVDFLQEVKAKQPCSACGKKSWVVMSGEPSEMVKIDFNGSEGRGLSVFSSYCANCGAIRSHAAPVVLEWLQNRSERSGDQIEDPDAGTTDE